MSSSFELNIGRPKVIVLFPVYNGGKLLKRSLENIANQSFADFKAVICENQSSDDSLAIAEEFAAGDDRFVVCRFDEHVGPIENFCRSMELVKGKSDYVCLRAHDDLSADNFLEELVNVLDADPSKWLGVCDSWRISADKTDVAKHRDVVLDIPNAIRKRRVPSRLYFPSDWFYMMYRNPQGSEIFLRRLPELSVVWSVASYVVAEFVYRGKVAYSPNTHFEFYFGSSSEAKYKPKGVWNILKARFEYFSGCYRVWQRTETQDILSRFLIAYMAWGDSGAKPKYQFRPIKALKTYLQGQKRS